MIASDKNASVRLDWRAGSWEALFLIARLPCVRLGLIALGDSLVRALCPKPQDKTNDFG